MKHLVSLGSRLKWGNLDGRVVGFEGVKEPGESYCKSAIVLVAVEGNRKPLRIASEQIERALGL
jgi:hypothetical protein